MGANDQIDHGGQVIEIDHGRQEIEIDDAHLERSLQGGSHALAALALAAPGALASFGSWHCPLPALLALLALLLLPLPLLLPLLPGQGLDVFAFDLDLGFRGPGQL